MTFAQEENKASCITPFDSAVRPLPLPLPTAAPAVDAPAVGPTPGPVPDRTRGVWRGSRAGHSRLGSLAVGSLIAGCFALASCGGGGGGSDTPTAVSGPGGTPVPAGAPYTVSGTLTISGAQTVDTDTNDPLQPGRRSNNSFNTVQPLPNPGFATGYLTVAGGGPDGPVKAAGDIVDGYSVRLQAGQVIELDYSADPRTVDVDLLLYDASRSVVGMSIGVNSYECIQIARAGDYVIAAQLYVDGSSSGTLYQLRVNRPSGARCANAQTTADTFDTESVIALPAAVGSAMIAPATKAERAGLKVLRPGAAAEGAEMLIAVPQDEPSMARVLASHRPPDATASSDAVIRKAEAAARGDADWQAGLSDQARRVNAAIKLSKSLVRSGQYAAATLNWNAKLFADRMPAFPPNDRHYEDQRWHYDLISLTGAASRLADFTPTPNVAPIVGVVDSGIVRHPDLEGQVLAGHDFVNHPGNGDGDGVDADPHDWDWLIGRMSHGTHVAGTIAAVTGNGTGVAGVAPVAKILPVRAMWGIDRERVAGSWYDIQQAIRYAAGLPNDAGVQPARRADVINLSLGVDSVPCDATTQGILNQARSAGILVVAAAGNASEENAMMPVGTPANCSNVIAVAATNAMRNRAWYSNGGPEIMVAAPGGDSGESLVWSTAAKVRGPGIHQLTYLGDAGTSMAAPHVAGVLALMRWINPQLTPAIIEQWIREGRIVDDIGTPGHDNESGHGLINAEKAVVAALESLGSSTPITQGRVSAQPSTLNFGSAAQTLEFTLGVVGTASERVASVTADGPSISVAPKAGAVDGATGLGTYVVTANRAAMTENSSLFPNVIIQLTPTRTLTVPVSIERRSAGGGGVVNPSAGPVYVLVLDASDNEYRVVAQANAPSPTQGAYTYSVTVPGTSRILVIAGTDLDNDGYVCTGGEACGAYPNLSTVRTIPEPTGNLTGIDFALTPVGGISAGSASASLVSRQ